MTLMAKSELLLTVALAEAPLLPTLGSFTPVVTEALLVIVPLAEGAICTLTVAVAPGLIVPRVQSIESGVVVVLNAQLPWLVVAVPAKLFDKETNVALSGPLLVIVVTNVRGCPTLAGFGLAVIATDKSAVPFTETVVLAELLIAIGSATLMLFTEKVPVNVPTCNGVATITTATLAPLTNDPKLQDDVQETVFAGKEYWLAIDTDGTVSGP